MRRTYGVTPSEYDAMSARQDGKCGICDGVFDRLMVDHCHKTGRVRGLLCRECNFAVGRLRDSPVNALAAAIYLLEA